MILLIDWGNSLLKTMQVESLDSDSIDGAKVLSWENLGQIKKHLQDSYANILVASVRSDEDNRALLDILNPLTESIFVAKTSEQACGVICAYDRPQELGIDRWLGVLAADSVASEVAVISIGSALTLDVICDHRHLGGQIIPGRRLLLSSLSQTGRVKASAEFDTADSFFLGRSTTECVHFGVEKLIEGFLVAVIKDCEVRYGIRHFLITGGGASYWSRRLGQEELHLECRPKLVFEGLARLCLQP